MPFPIIRRFDFTQVQGASTVTISGSSTWRTKKPLRQAPQCQRREVITKHFLEAHGDGTFRLMGELRCPGRGTTWTCYALLLILVVEDDPLIALDLKATLEHAGVVVLGPAGRLNDAMLLAEKSLPVAAVLDVRLEVGTSLPLAKWLAERDVPFLFQTSDPTLIDAAYSAAPVLRKPFRPEQLIAALAALLAKER